jgi:hypothetical protein
MEHLNSHMEQQQSIQWRRDKVQELSSQGNSQREISKILRVGIGTINRDLTYLRHQAKHNIRRYIDERLPEEYEKCLVGLTAILREAWNTSQQTEDRREKIQALSLAKDCYSMKLDLLTNATVVDDAIRFVASESEKSKDKVRVQVESSSFSPSDSSNEDNNKESNEPDYNDDEKSDKGGEEKQEQETGEITTTITTNQVF